MRIDPSVFRKLDLRVHGFLADVPLHDVWRVELAPREGVPTMQDVREAMSTALRESLNPVVRSLFALRAALGRLFRWDGEPVNRASRSYAQRLTEKDRERSLEPPGKVEGPFRLLYVFPGEALAEAINRTVHAFSCLALVPQDEGYFLYWAIYVRPGNALSRFYMALIDPFRHWLVYPSILRNVERAWRGAAAL